MLRRATLVLVAAAALAPVAGAGRYSDAAALCTPHPPQRAVVRTELVPGSSDGFDWLDAAAGFGLAIASVAVGLLVVAVHRPRVRSAKN